MQLAEMVYSWAFARHTKLLDALCSIPALSAAARQAGQASTSQIHLCSTRMLSLPLAGHQGRQTASSAVMLPQGPQTHSFGALAQLMQPSAIVDCRTFHGSTRPHRIMQGSRECLESTEPCESRQSPERIQRRTAFGLPNLNGDPSKKYHERRLIG